jgi:hypothetical protein
MLSVYFVTVFEQEIKKLHFKTDPLRKFRILWAYVQKSRLPLQQGGIISYSKFLSKT